VTNGGHVLTVHTSAGTAAFDRPRPALAGATTSSPTLAVDSQGRVRLFAVTGEGTLVERHTDGTRSDRWSHARRLGLPGSWSTHAAVVTASDVKSHLWLAAVTRHGHLLSQHSTNHGNRWSGFRAVDHRVWSATSTPALADAPDGRLWLASVGARGRLVVRHTGASGDRWQAGERQPGLWSPYSSPAMSVDPRGRTWLAAVGTDGELTVLWKPVDANRWRSSGGLPRVPRSETGSAALATTVDGVLVGATDGRGRLVWRRPLGQPGPQTTRGPRGGGFSINRFL
jgi:hypothetical protein